MSSELDYYYYYYYSIGHITHTLVPKTRSARNKTQLNVDITWRRRRREQCLLIEAVEEESGGFGELGGEGFGGRGGSVKSNVRGRGVEALWVLQPRACSRHRHLSLTLSVFSLDHSFVFFFFFLLMCAIQIQQFPIRRSRNTCCTNVGWCLVTKQRELQTQTACGWDGVSYIIIILYFILFYWLCTMQLQASQIHHYYLPKIYF